MPCKEKLQRARNDEIALRVALKKIDAAIFETAKALSILEEARQEAINSFKSISVMIRECGPSGLDE